jgi:TetR/AcrR family transcriptional repressor of mexJK operon
MRTAGVLKKNASFPKSKEGAGERRYSQGRPTLEDLEQRKTRVLEIATALFLTKGYAETSLVEIAKQAGVATRTIYQHFGNKEEIFRVVLERRATDDASELPTFRADQQLFDALIATANYICAVAFSGAAIPFQRLMIAESQRFPELMREIVAALFQRLHVNVTTTFEWLAAAEKIPAGGHAESTKYFIDLLLGSAPLRVTMNWDNSGPSEKEVRDKVSLFMIGRFGLAPDASSSSLRHTPRIEAPVS